MTNTFVTLSSGPCTGQKWFRSGEIIESIVDDDFHREQVRQRNSIFECRGQYGDDAENDVDEDGWGEWGELDDECTQPIELAWKELMSLDPSTSEGRKDDQEKVRLDLLPFEALEEVGKVLTYAERKYAAWNWLKGMAWHRLFGAALRHLWAWHRGEKHDPESGCSHLAHACCCILFLLTFELKGLGTDDRPI